MKKSDLADRVVEYILRCRDEDLGFLSVEKIAGIFKVSESFLARKFRTDKDFTLGKFIFRERMFRAALLLRGNHGLTVKTLSEKIGFYDHDYFGRIFKKYYGITPTRYRYCKKKEKNSKSGTGKMNRQAANGRSLSLI